MNDFETTIWKFIRHDLSALDFEQWIYAHPELETYFGSETYLEVIASGFVQDYHVYDLRKLLRKWMEEHSHRECDCITWQSRQHLAEAISDWGFHEQRHYLAENFVSRKERNRWAGLVQCKICQQPWYFVISDELFDYWLLRLSAEQTEQILRHDFWPADFDDFNPKALIQRP